MSAPAPFVGGLAGRLEDQAFARICVWCDIPHPLGPVDRQLLDQGAQVTHCMCPAAGARLDAELERAREAACR